MDKIGSTSLNIPQAFTNEVKGEINKQLGGDSISSKRVVIRYEINGEVTGIAQKKGGSRDVDSCVNNFVEHITSAAANKTEPTFKLRSVTLENKKTAWFK